MRRIVLWAMSTLTVLVLLFSYSTSRSSSAVVAETRQVTTSSKTSDSTGSTSGSSSASSTDSSGQEPDRRRHDRLGNDVVRHQRLERVVGVVRVDQHLVGSQDLRR